MSLISAGFISLDSTFKGERLKKLMGLKSPSSYARTTPPVGCGNDDRKAYILLIELFLGIRIHIYWIWTQIQAFW